MYCILVCLRIYFDPAHALPRRGIALAGGDPAPIGPQRLECPRRQRRSALVRLRGRLLRAGSAQRCAGHRICICLAGAGCAICSPRPARRSVRHCGDRGDLGALSSVRGVHHHGRHHPEPAGDAMAFPPHRHCGLAGGVHSWNPECRSVRIFLANGALGASHHATQHRSVAGSCTRAGGIGAARGIRARQPCGRTQASRSNGCGPAMLVRSRPAGHSHSQVAGGPARSRWIGAHYRPAGGAATVQFGVSSEVDPVASAGCRRWLPPPSWYQRSWLTAPSAT